jgi:RHS repeat-associated protein
MSLYTPPTVAGTGPTQFDYYPDRQLNQITRPDSKTVTFTYEPTSGRLHAMSISRGQYAFGYDPASPGTGHLVSVTAPDNGILKFAYQGALLQSATWSGTVAGSVSQTFDTNFRGSSISVNGSAVSFGYDNDGLIKQAGALAVRRDLPTKNAFVTRVTIGNVSEVITPNDFGEVVGTSATCSGGAGPQCNNTSLLTETYVRDQMGRVSMRTEAVLGGPPVTLEYRYDVDGRLREVLRNGTTAAIYTMDSNSNRQKVTRNGTDTVGTYDNQDRLTQYGATSYSYTANGELQTRTDSSGTATYSYDELGALLQVTLPSGTVIDYVIDGRGRRTGKKVSGVLVQGFLYQDRLRPVAELDGANNVVSRFVYATRRNVPDYIVKNGSAYRVISDRLGSPRLIVDVSAGTIAQRMDYDEFGQVVLDTNPGFQPFGFAGGLYDRDTKLVRFGGRDYDAEIGRWTAKDPIRFNGGTANLYVYGNANPISHVDPNGLCVEDLCVGEAAAALAFEKAFEPELIDFAEDAAQVLGPQLEAAYETTVADLAEAGWQFHHIFPVEFSDLFEDLGIDVDQWTIMLPDRVHWALHGLGWNAIWEEWLEDALERGATAGDAGDFAKGLMYGFGFWGPNAECGIVPYPR